jgi:cytochrome c-type biogenesis protein CcmH
MRWSELLSSRVSFGLLGIVVIVCLVVGAHHPASTTRAARIAHLDAVIKCPPCDDLSIAQSNVPQAHALRDSVAQWVDAGWSDARIEAKVVELYGQDELLSPKNSALWLIPVIAALIGALGLGAVLLKRSREASEIVVDEAAEASVRAARATRAER